MHWPGKQSLRRQTLSLLAVGHATCVSIISEARQHVAPPQVHDAVELMLRTWAVERRHEEQSTYRYAELPRGGKGPESNYTGALGSEKQGGLRYAGCTRDSCMMLRGQHGREQPRHIAAGIRGDCRSLCVLAAQCRYPESAAHDRQCSAGMIWSGFRPSDDPNTYGYNIPGNMYAWGALQRARSLNAQYWQDDSLEALALDLSTSIR